MEPVSREEFNAFREVHDERMTTLLTDVAYLRGKADEKTNNNKDWWSRLGVIGALVGLVVTWLKGGF